MSVYTIMFAGSLVLILGMIASRILYERLHDEDEHFFHRMLTHRARRMNLSLKGGIKKCKQILKYFNKKTFALFVHLVIESVEEYFHKAMDFVRSKFPHHK